MALYIVYKKIRTALSLYLLFNLLKERYITSVKIYEYLNKFTLLDTLKIHSQFFALSFFHFISNELNGVNINLLTQIVAFL